MYSACCCLLSLTGCSNGIEHAAVLSVADDRWKTLSLLLKSPSLPSPLDFMDSVIISAPSRAVHAVVVMLVLDSETRM